jgi:hypothetical protein
MAKIHRSKVSDCGKFVEVWFTGVDAPYIIDYDDFIMDFNNKESWYIHPSGYLCGRNYINKKYMYHRFLYYGLSHKTFLPLINKDSRLIDHINRNPRDNRKLNLREVSVKENIKNSSRTDKSTSELIRKLIGLDGRLFHIRIAGPKGGGGVRFVCWDNLAMKSILSASSILTLSDRMNEFFKNGKTNFNGARVNKYKFYLEKCFSDITGYKIAVRKSKIELYFKNKYIGSYKSLEDMVDKKNKENLK